MQFQLFTGTVETQLLAQGIELDQNLFDVGLFLLLELQ